MTAVVKVVAYDAAWPKLFDNEAQKIKAALGFNCITIHHAGSTAVPGLSAKPVIDIFPVVLDITDVDKHTQDMTQLGYESKGEYGIPFRRFFQKRGDGCSANVHVYEEGASEIDRHLKFRDWMRASSDDRKQYEQLKKELALKYPNDIFSYCMGKEAFVLSIDKKAGSDGTRLVQALTDNEWASYHRIRDEQIFSQNGVLYDKNHPTLSQENHFHFVFIQGNVVLSVAHIELLNNNEAALRGLATDAPYKHQGFAKKLLILLEKWVKQKGIEVIKLHAYHAADAFYRKYGYIDMAFDDVPLSQDTVDLGKRL